MISKRRTRAGGDGCRSAERPRAGKANYDSHERDREILLFGVDQDVRAARRRSGDPGERVRLDHGAVRSGMRLTGSGSSTCWTDGSRKMKREESHQIVRTHFAFLKFLSAVMRGAFSVMAVAEIIRSAGSLLTSEGSLVDSSATWGDIP